MSLSPLRVTGNRWLAGVVASLAVCSTLVFSASASADARDPRPVKLVPAPSASISPGEISPLLAVPQRYLCSGEGTLRNVPDGFVMGWCRNGWPIDLNRPHPSGYQGWAYGNYDGCGWIYAMHIGSAQTGWGHTCTASTNQADFMSYKNLPNGSSTPTQVSSHGTCAAYLNTRPWAAGGLTDYVGTIPSASLIEWRYRTRSANAYMVRTPAISQNWVFVPVSCFPLPATRYLPNA
jgi:hypothetical protein